MTRDTTTELAFEAYRAHHAQRRFLFASGFIGLGLFAIAYATWPANQNKDLAEPLGVTMTGLGLLLIAADTQMSVQIERLTRWLAERTTTTPTGHQLRVLQGPPLRAQSIIFAVLAVMWGYLASIGAGGAPLRGMVVSASGALILLVYGTWRIHKAQSG